MDRIHMACLAREIEQEIAVTHPIAHLIHVADIRSDNLNPILDVPDVEKIGAGIPIEAIDDDDAGAKVEQAAREMRADEAEAAGYYRLRAVQPHPAHGEARRKSGRCHCAR